MRLPIDSLTRGGRSSIYLVLTAEATQLLCRIMQEQDIPRAPTRVAMLTERAEGEPRAETRGVPVSAYQLT